IPLKKALRRVFIGFEGGGFEMRVHVTQDFLEPVPWPPAVHVARFIGATNHERREAADPERLAFVSISLECVVRGTVLQGPNKCRSQEHTSELQSRPHLVCRLLLEKKNLDAQLDRYRDRAAESP